jgi:hypothetical protein
MVMGVPPCSLVGRHETAALATHTLRVSLEVNLFGPPLGLLHSSSIEILGEGGEEGIGQCDHFVMV